MSNYLFTSHRLGFRNWKESDLHPMAEINADQEVMEFFPGTQSEQETLNFIKRMQKQFSEKGFCYFAVDILDGGEFIGFIGLSEQVFEADFTPCIDIGWRLKKREWGKGYTGEGAKACLDFAFHQLKIDKVYAMAPAVNHRSEKVMKKIGMKKVKTFDHPKLLNDTRLRECILYQKLKS